MFTFIGVILGLVTITVIIQLITNMKIVGGNQLGIKSGVSGHKGFSMITGGEAIRHSAHSQIQQNRPHTDHYRSRRRVCHS